MDPREATTTIIIALIQANEKSIDLHEDVINTTGEKIAKLYKQIHEAIVHPQISNNSHS